MAGISADLFERVFAETDVAVAIDSPVMYEVWRENALRGPTARRRLLLRLADDANARDVARRLNQTAEMLDITRAEAVGVIGEWLLVRADLEYLVRVLLPQTRWGRLLAIIGSLPRGTLEELLAPLEELLARTGGTTTPRSDGAETPSELDSRARRYRTTHRHVYSSANVTRRLRAGCFGSWLGFGVRR